MASARVCIFADVRGVLARCGRVGPFCWAIAHGFAGDLRRDREVFILDGRSFNFETLVRCEED